MKQKPGREMPEFCRNREADVLRFAYALMADQQYLGARCPAPESTAKISGHLTSNDVTQNCLDIPGHLDTGKHGPSALEAPEQFILGHPRMPPAQLISP